MTEEQTDRRSLNKVSDLHQFPDSFYVPDDLDTRSRTRVRMGISRSSQTVRSALLVSANSRMDNSSLSVRANITKVVPSLKEEFFVNEIR